MLDSNTARNFLLKMSCNFFWISNQLPNNFPIGEKFWIEVKSRRGKEEEKMAEQGKDVSFVGRISQISMKLFINTESRSLWLFEGVSLTFLRWETFACWIELVAVSRNLRKRSWIGRRSCTYSSKFTVKIYNKFLQRFFYWSFYLFWFLAFYFFFYYIHYFAKCFENGKSEYWMRISLRNKIVRSLWNFRGKRRLNTDNNL